jgi:hypothetical protein
MFAVSRRNEPSAWQLAGRKSEFDISHFAGSMRDIECRLCCGRRQAFARRGSGTTTAEAQRTALSQRMQRTAHREGPVRHEPGSLLGTAALEAHAKRPERSYPKKSRPVARRQPVVCGLVRPLRPLRLASSAVKQFALRLRASAVSSSPRLRTGDLSRNLPARLTQPKYCNRMPWLRMELM